MSKKRETGARAKLTALPEAEERRLLAAAQHGDREAMERIVAQYLPLVRAAGAQRRAQTFAEDATAAAAEELVRTVYAYDAARGVPFAAIAKIRVYGAVSHLCRKLRTQWERECTPAEAEDLDDLAEDGAASASFAAVDARLTAERLLAALPAEGRRLLRLLYGAGKTTREAAAILGLSPSTIMRRKKAALAKLREAAGDFPLS